MSGTPRAHSHSAYALPSVVRCDWATERSGCRQAFLQLHAWTPARRASSVSVCARDVCAALKTLHRPTVPSISITAHAAARESAYASCPEQMMSDRVRASNAGGARTSLNDRAECYPLQNRAPTPAVFVASIPSCRPPISSSIYLI